MSLHSWGSDESNSFADLFELSFGAWETASKMLDTSLFQSILQRLPEDYKAACLARVVISFGVAQYFSIGDDVFFEVCTLLCRLAESIKYASTVATSF